MVRRRGPAVPLALAGVLWLAVTAPAFAWRPPTAKERTQITRAARHEVASTQRVRVTDIRIADSGRWASADVTTYLRGSAEPEMEAADSFRRVEGVWRPAGTATMPAEDQT